MSLRNRIILPIAISALAVLAACGGNSASTITNPTPPPSGSFSASNLNGTYVVSVSGVDTNGAPYAVAGTITANGTGGITSGAIDMNDVEFTAPVANLAVGSNSTYKVSVDGRGEATLNVTTPLGSSIVLDFVLQDSSHGLVTEFDNTATGSGTIDAQTASVSPAGAYAFSMLGSTFGGSSFATVGNFTVAGGTISGLEDFNSAQFAYPDEGLTGQVVLGPSSTPSTTLTTTQFGALTFDAFAIDATHLKLIEMDLTATLSGDAYSQSSTTIPTGTLAFTLAGGISAPVAAGGFMVTDGAGNITSASTEDVNDAGNISTLPVSFSGQYASAETGRYTLSNLSGFVGTTYAAYPSSGGVLLLEIDDSGLMSGAAYTQTAASTFSTSGGYGLNLSGFNQNNSVEVDDIAEFATNASGATVTGVIDENATGIGPNFGLALSGTYTTPDSNGRGQIAANAGTSSNSTLNGGFGLTFYTVDGTTFPFIETDNATGQVSLGVFVAQNPSASSSAVAKPHMFVVRPLIRAKSSFKKLK